MVKQILSSFRNQDSFLRNASITVFGSGIGIVLQFISTPILSRIYTPEAYGQLSVLNIFISNLIIILPLSYLDSLLYLNGRLDFKRMFAFIFFLSLVGSCLVYFIIALLQLNGVNTILDTPIKIFYFIPIVVFLSVLGESLRVWNVRKKRFSRNVKVGLVLKLLNKSSTISYGYFVSGTGTGLILGDLVQKFSRIFITLPIGELYRTFRMLITGTNIREMRSVAIKYIKYPLYILPSSFLNQFKHQIPLFVISFFFSASMLGLYTFSLSLLSIPTRLLGLAVEPVVVRKIQSIGLDKLADIRIFAFKYFRITFYLTLVPQILIFLFARPLFIILFGVEWADSGTYTSILIFAITFQVITLPLSSLRKIMGKEKDVLAFNIFSVCLFFLLIPLCFILKDEMLIIVAIGIMIFIFEAVNLFRIYKIIGATNQVILKQMIPKMLLVISLVTLLTFFFKL